MNKKFFFENNSKLTVKKVKMKVPEKTGFCELMRMNKIEHFLKQFSQIK